MVGGGGEGEYGGVEFGVVIFLFFYTTGTIVIILVTL